MLINKRGHYCEFIYINTAVVVVILLSLRKTRQSRIIKVQGACRVCRVDTRRAARVDMRTIYYYIIYAIQCVLAIVCADVIPTPSHPTHTLSPPI